MCSIWSKVMTGLKQEIVKKFYELLKVNNVVYEYEDFNHNGVDYNIYTFDYLPDFLLFMSTFTHLDVSLFKQYISIKDFEHLLFDHQHRMSVKALLSDNQLQFEIASTEAETNRPDICSFFYVIVDTQDVVSIQNVRNGDFNSNFYRTYNEVLSNIKKTLKTTSMTSQQMLNIYYQDTYTLLNNRLAEHNIKAIPLSVFIDKYANYVDIPLPSSTEIPLSEYAFMLFLKDNFPSDFYHKIRQITSFLCFQEKFCNRGESIFNYSHFNVFLSTVSKYSTINRIYTLRFCLMPNENRQININVNDNGTIGFSCFLDNQHIILNDLDDIYNHIKDEFIINIEKTLSVNREDVTADFLKLYAMVNI
jgi:hypothetical protein